MINRMFKRIVLFGAFLAISGHTQTSSKIVLYDGSQHINGHIEQNSLTFPEAPEWISNWGNFDNMQSPYIRFSGQKSFAGDWKSSLTFNVFPLNIQDGALELKVRSTQNAKFGIWLSTKNGVSNIHYEHLEANKTHSLSIPLENFAQGKQLEIQKIWVGLFDIPANQYTTLFIDDISFSNKPFKSNEAEHFQAAHSMLNAPYKYLHSNPSSPIRQNLWKETNIPEASAEYGEKEQDSLSTLTAAKFILDDQEHQQILAVIENDSPSPQDSRNAWYKCLFLVNRNRLQDSIIANPKKLFHDAQGIASIYDMQQIPLLLADVDYDYKVCTDTLCSKNILNSYRLLLAGFPTSFVNGSKVKIIYDPYFVATMRQKLPSVEICIQNRCQILKASSEIYLDFPSAGLQKITLNLQADNITTKQVLSLEVK